MKTYTHSERQLHLRTLIHALRSGRYVQTRGWLRIVSHSNQDQSEAQEHFGPIGYCCLGVACDLMNPSNWIIEPYNHYAMFGLGDLNPESDDNNSSFLPPEAMAYYGFRNEAGEYTDVNGVTQTLSQDNDNGKSFFDIADLISCAMSNPAMNMFTETTTSERSDSDSASTSSTSPQSDPVSVAIKP
jgi:hypothetical protein